MGIRSVRFDPLTEALLEALVSATGKSVTDVMKDGVVALIQARANDVSTRPYDIFAELTLHADRPKAPRSKQKRAVRAAIARKLSRR